MPRPRHCRAAPHAARQRTQPRAGWRTPSDAVDTPTALPCLRALPRQPRRMPPLSSRRLCRSHVSLGRFRLFRARRRASSPRRCALRRNSWMCLIGRSRRRACRPIPEHSIATVVDITCGPNGLRLGSIISDVGRKPEVWEKPRRRSFAQEWPCRQVKQATLASGRRCES